MGVRWIRVLSLLFVTVLAGLSCGVQPALATKSFASKIAFVRSGDVWICDPDGGHATWLTRGKADDQCPAWSSDHSSVFFVRHSGSAWLVAVVSAKTKRVDLIVYRDPDTGKYRPRRISAIAPRRSGRVLYFGDLYEGKRTPVVRIVRVDMRSHTATSVFKSVNYEQIIHTMSLAPDSAQLAFTITGGDQGKYWLLDTGSLETTRPITQSIDGACWAPSGAQLAFSTVNNFPDPDHVFVAGPAGDASTDVPGASGSVCAFSSDGSRILFQDGARLYTIGVDGSGRSRVTFCSPAFDEPAAW